MSQTRINWLKNRRESNNKIFFRQYSAIYLNNFENKSVLCQDPEHVYDAGDHPGLHGRQTLRLRGGSGHEVENVHQDEEQSHQQRHPAFAKF